ncbi:polysaccharide deacetylase family protein [Clostridium vincentii]|uniref:Peptidoglycan-N-acetylmuramic acid deacetylase PdaA n=1 Tax=Clostridium vincentii TaxID=52704 RepID=A0A2T0B6L1_9CLOT|nr:polysaccharide deacetylase family protein [Clostridium vincentii]PRR79505.1 Peptidoglycan-N-acetylmuramic acid deacetylase PdaA precursor [Clostridium vincentii]
MKKFIVFIVTSIMLSGIICVFINIKEREVMSNKENEVNIDGTVKDLNEESVEIKKFNVGEILFNISVIDKESIEKITKLKVIKQKDTVYLNDQPESNSVYLTFDDGPDGEVTPRILDILESYNVKGNFFFLGENAKMYPEVVKRTFDSGNFIGNHTYYHEDLTTLSPEGIKDELEKTEEVISSITGKRTTAMRPPYGASNETVIKVIKDSNSVSILWSIDTLDWSHKEVSSILKVSVK